MLITFLKPSFSLSSTQPIFIVMTEYDFSPDAMNQYRNTQDRINHWVGAPHEYPERYGPSMSQNDAAFRSGHMGGYDRDYDTRYGTSSRRHGRHRGRYQDRHQHRGRSRERVYRGEEFPSHGVPPTFNRNMPPSMAGSQGPHSMDPNIQHNPHGTMPGSFPATMPMGSRQGSVAQSMSRQPSGILNPGQPMSRQDSFHAHHHEGELPLPVHPSPTPQEGGPNFTPTHTQHPADPAHIPPLPMHGSHRGYPRSGADSGRHIQVPMSMSSSGRNELDGGYHSRRRSRSRSRSRSRLSRSHSRDSYTSYSSYSSYSPNGHSRSPSRHQSWRHGQSLNHGNYQMIHPSPHTPTVINPSQNVPILIPINGGNGGYVVVPPVGQEVRVVVRTSFLPRRIS